LQNSYYSSSFQIADKSSTGLIEWNNIAEAAEALVSANHYEISHSGNICFYFEFSCKKKKIIKKTTSFCVLFSKQVSLYHETVFQLNANIGRK
jgi:hypothetical protein